MPLGVRVMIETEGKRSNCKATAPRWVIAAMIATSILGGGMVVGMAVAIFAAAAALVGAGIYRFLHDRWELWELDRRHGRNRGTRLCGLWKASFQFPASRKQTWPEFGFGSIAPIGWH